MQQASDPVFESFRSLSPLTHQEQSFLRRLANPARELAPKQRIITEGIKEEQAFFVERGWLVQYKIAADGDRQILNFRLRGDIVGTQALAYEAAPHSVAALGAAAVIPLPLNAFLEMQHRFPRLAKALLKQALREQSMLHQWEVNLGRRDASERLAHMLLELHFRLGRRGLADGESFELVATQNDVADAVGLTPEHVNRIFQRMRRDDLIEFEDRRVVLKQPERLKKVADFDPAYLVD